MFVHGMYYKGVSPHSSNMKPLRRAGWISIALLECDSSAHTTGRSWTSDEVEDEVEEARRDFETASHTQSTRSRQTCMRALGLGSKTGERATYRTPITIRSASLSAIHTMNMRVVRCNGRKYACA